MTARLHNDDEVTDGWFSDAFPVSISLSNIPDDATYRMQLNLLESHGDATPGAVDTEFGSGSLVILLEDATGPED